MQSNYIFRFLTGLSLYFFITFPLFAQIFGCQPGETLKSNQCTTSAIIPTIKRDVKTLLIDIVIPLYFASLIAVVAFDVWQTKQGKISIFQKLGARGKTFVIATGILLLLPLIPSMLRSIGVSENYLHWLDALYSILPIEHAYAANSGTEPFIKGTIIDIISLGGQILLKFIAIPIIAGAWFYAGFLYVAAQGNPEKITYAHRFITGVIVATLVILFIEGFLFSYKKDVLHASVPIQKSIKETLSFTG